MKKISLILIFGLLMAGCSTATPPTEEVMSEEPTMSEPEATPTDEDATQAAAPLTLSSPSFEYGQAIPLLFSCDGKDISPLLQWSEPPKGTQSLALIADDPDAPMGTWVHWVVYNLPAERRELPQGVPAGETIEGGGVQGVDTSQHMGYGGPCPPSGTHRYFFKLYALDTVLDAEAGLSKGDLESAMQGHILAQAELMGTYTRNN